MFLINTLAVVLGLALGFSLQRGGFCMNTIFRSIAFEKDYSHVRSWVLILVMNIFFVHLLDELAIITISRAPLFVFALIPGGLIFGVGMVLAGGCTSGSCYRAGRGMLGSAGALVGFGIGALLFGNGLASGIQRSLRSFTVDVQGEAASLWNILGIDYTAWKWVIIGIIVLVATVGLIQAPKQKYVLGWKWWQTGIAIGTISILAWVLSAFAFRDFGLSFTQPIQSWGSLLLNGDASGINVASFMILGVPFGAYFAAARAGEARLTLPDPKRFVQQFAGGSLMGVGASIAGGCNIGHGITGVSTLSISSILATLFTMFGVWIATWFIFKRESSAA